jgi:heat shock protein HslJ
MIMTNKFFIVCLIIMVSGCTQTPAKYLTINVPANLSVIKADQDLLVQGEGKGLYENNVVIKIEDLSGNALMQVPTTMKTDKIGGSGQWEKNISLSRPVPAKIKITSFSPSPKDGEAAINSQSIVLTIDNPLLKTQWQLEQYLQPLGQLTGVLPKTKITAEFEDKKISGSAGCNRYSGGYQLNKSEITFPGPITATMMACSTEISTQEQHYLKVLSGVASYQLQQNKLILLDKEQQTILIYRYIQSIALENTHWQAIIINNGRGGVVSNANTHLVSAQFSDSEIKGNAGCNQFSANYVVNNHQLKIGPVRTTRKYCSEEGVMDLEQQFLMALKQSTQYEIKADKLRLRNANGSLQIGFSRKD